MCVTCAGRPCVGIFLDNMDRKILNLSRICRMGYSAATLYTLQFGFGLGLLFEFASSFNANQIDWHCSTTGVPNLLKLKVNFLPPSQIYDKRI